MSIPDPHEADPEQEWGVLQPQDALDDVGGVVDVLDTGWSPPDHPWAVHDWGTTQQEESASEALGRRLAREVPDPGEWYGDGLGDTSDTDGELIDGEVGHRRAGRLVDPGAQERDPGSCLYAADVGIDGAGAAAEEAAVHVVVEWLEDPYGPPWP
ncbi:DUF5709 domain-containing protein [Modestobacter excelsi]|uniref:DUF5709 domain-containing protein n=1 Tax=Modestobacter excelsi TaxID=2213161 RepID=UPI001C20E79F|nr:DUF5709 domain-containing protein [Modestobacter excelsi]